MLVLTRKLGEEIVTSNGMTIRVVGLTKGKVRLGIIAPKDVVIDRYELRVKKDADKESKVERANTASNR